MLSNCGHEAGCGRSPDSSSFERFALGRYAIQQIVPGLGERGNAFIEQLRGHAVSVNTGFSEFG